MPSIPTVPICTSSLKVVLNLIITGMPSILMMQTHSEMTLGISFKPYYNWNAFNTEN